MGEIGSRVWGQDKWGLKFEKNIYNEKEKQCTYKRNIQ